MKKLILPLLSSLCVTLSVPSFAGTSTWDFSTNNSWTRSLSFDSAEGDTVSISSYLVDTANYLSSGSVEQGWVGTNSFGIVAASWSGDRTSNGDWWTHHGDHAIDSFGKTNFNELVLFDFEEAVSLATLDIGWAYEKWGHGSSDNAQRADISIIRMSDKAVFNIGDLSAGSYDLSVYNSVNFGFSSQWVIAAYNHYFGGSHLSGGFSDNFHEQKGDAFKIKGLSVITRDQSGHPDGDVPEPANFAFIMLGFGLLTISRIKRKKASR